MAKKNKPAGDEAQEGSLATFAQEAEAIEQRDEVLSAPQVPQNKPTHPHEVELTREDREAITALAQEKARSGLPLEMALVSAETQVREDRCGLYARVRNAFAPKQGATTAKA